MKVWIDCEFNGYGGELISIALVDENDRALYEVLGCKDPSPWVAEHVMPLIEHCARTPRRMVSQGIEAFLSIYPTVHIVADWPDDIRYLCELILTGPGTRIDTPPLTFEVLRVDPVSELPHEALADARALRALCLSTAAPATRVDMTPLCLWRKLSNAFVGGATFAGLNLSDRLLNVRTHDAAEGYAGAVLKAHGHTAPLTPAARGD